MIDEKERWTAKRIRLALRVADARLRYLRGCVGYGDVREQYEEANRAMDAYRAFMDAGKPKGKGKGRKR